MKNQDYDKTIFYSGIEAKVDDIWYPVATTDFSTRETICQTPNGDKEFPVESIQEFSKMEDMQTSVAGKKISDPKCLNKVCYYYDQMMDMNCSANEDLCEKCFRTSDKHKGFTKP